MRKSPNQSVERRRQTLLPGQLFDAGTVEFRLDRIPDESAAQPPQAYLKPGMYRVS